MGTRVHWALAVGVLFWPWLSWGGQALEVDIEASHCSDTGGAPFCHIQAAIDRASPGATVAVAAGIYELWGESLSIDKSLTLMGAGAERTIIDGEGRNPGPLISIADTAEEVLIAAVTLTNRMRVVTMTAGAGGIDHFGQHLTISDATIKENLGGMGGALHAGTDFGSVMLRNVKLSDNDALVGGAIDFRDAPGAQLEVIDSEILNNNAIFTGGGVFVRDVGAVTFTNVTLSGNESGNRGGGIYIVSQNEAGDLELRDSKVTGNWSKGTGGIDTSGNDVEVRLKGVVLAGNSSRGSPESNDCGAESAGTFTSLGGNVVGNGDGCGLRALAGDSIGTTGAPVKP